MVKHWPLGQISKTPGGPPTELEYLSLWLQAWTLELHDVALVAHKRADGLFGKEREKCHLRADQGGDGWGRMMSRPLRSKTTVQIVGHPLV